VLNFPYSNSDSEHPVAEEGEPPEASAMDLPEVDLLVLDTPEASANREGNLLDRVLELENEVMELKVLERHIKKVNEAL